MKELRFIIRGRIKFQDSNIAKTVFRAIYPDVVRNEVKDVSIMLNLVNENVYFEIQSSSYAKFRGTLTSLLRLIRVAIELIEEVRV